MPVPPKPVLRAAVRWLERLPESGVVRSRSVFVTHSEFGDITPTQYDAAYAWLRSTGLLETLHSRVPVQRRVFDAAMAHGGTHWFPDVDRLVQVPDELPEDALRAAEAVELSQVDAYSQLKSVWGKVDTEERVRVGLAGELALVELLTVSTSARIEHVAAWSDGFGYDISVDDHRCSAHLEVKSTTRRGRLTVFLSRNEYETMIRDPAWRLVAVRLTKDLEPAAIASIPRSWIEAQVPFDCGPHGRWESFRLDVASGVIESGIPGIAPLLTERSALLNGFVEWPG